MSQPQQLDANEARLRRELGVVLAAAVTVNAMVGTGIFRLAPNVLQLAGSSTAALAVWVAGGVISLCGALCIAELAAALPRAGGIYPYLRHAYGRVVAFWYGWTRLTLLGPAAAGSFARLAAESLGAVLGWAPDAGRDTLVAVAVLVGCTLVNLSGVRTASTEQAILTALKFAGLTVLALACLSSSSSAAVPPDPDSLARFAIGGAFSALVSVMWTYDGWADVSSLAGESRQPGRTMPIALVAGTGVVTAVFVLVNVGYLHVLGAGGVAASGSGSEMVAMRAAELSLGEHGRRVLAALVFTSCLGTCMVGILTGSRVYVSMASDGFWRWLGHVSPRTGVPARAVVIGCGLGIVYLSFRSFEQLTDSFVSGMFPFYMLAVVAVLLLRRRQPELPRPFRTPLYPLLALVFLLGASALLWGAARDVHGIAFAAFGVMLLGLPLGFALSRRATAGA